MFLCFEDEVRMDNKNRSYRLGIILVGSREEIEEVNSQLKDIIPKSVGIIKQTLTANMVDLIER